MIRPASDRDWPQINALRKATGEYLANVSDQDNDETDGTAMVDEEGGRIVGVIWYFLGKPETWIRSICVDPQVQDINIARRLIASLMHEAAQHGSVVIEGFDSGDRNSWVKYAKMRGAHITPGNRIRYSIDDQTMQRASQLLQGDESSRRSVDIVPPFQ